MASWPGSLPQKFQMNRYSESAPDNMLIQGMDVGVPKLRKRTSGGYRPVSGSLLLTTAQVATLDTFYADNKTLSFDWVNSRTGSAESFYFAAPPSYSSSGVHLMVSISLMQVE